MNSTDPQAVQAARAASPEPLQVDPVLPVDGSQTESAQPGLPPSDTPAPNQTGLTGDGNLTDPSALIYTALPELTHVATFASLSDILASYLPEKDQKRVREAYRFA